MSLQREKRFKEATPKETVSKVKKILKAIDINIVEEWLPESSVGTYSLRLYISNSKLGANGKGVTKELARASAYAELLERYQNIWLARSAIRWENKFKFNYFVDEQELTAEEIVKSNNSFIKMYFSNRNISNADINKRIEAFKKIQKIDFNIFSKKTTYTCIPFYNVKEKKIDYLPYNTYSQFYGSNGMCAGNSAEEALVQGLSEIIERYILKKIFKEKPCLPDVPNSYLGRFPYLLEKFEMLKKLDNYTFLLKDCSFGGKYPAVALIIIEKNTGRYGIKVGCHPDYLLAIERCFTEAAQGNDITEYVNRSKLNFNNNRVNDPINICNCFRIGFADYPFELLGAQPSFDFIPVKDVSNKSNRDILKDMINNLIKEGYDILIHNVSYLGFPSYHIIIPGISEVIDMTDEAFNAINTRLFVSELLNKPEEINKDNCNNIIKNLDYYSTSILDNEMRTHYGVLINFYVPGEEIRLGWLYLSAMCKVMLGNYEDASKRMLHIVRLAKNDNVNKYFYNAVYYYVSGMSIIKNHDEVIKYLKNFFSTEICIKINDLFHDTSKVITKQYVTHDYFNRNKCREVKCCDYHVYADIIDKYKSFQLKNYIKQEELITLFDDL